MRSLVLILMAAVLFSCGNKKQGSVSSLKKEVMALHDEVMPKMGELRKTQKQLLLLADSTGTDSLEAAKYKQLAETIKLANESMMDWMRNFDPAFQGNDEEVKEYLMSQKESITKVKNGMLNSLEAGKKALE